MTEIVILAAMVMIVPMAAIIALALVKTRKIEQSSRKEGFSDEKIAEMMQFIRELRAENKELRERILNLEEITGDQQSAFFTTEIPDFRQKSKLPPKNEN